MIVAFAASVPVWAASDSVVQVTPAPSSSSAAPGDTFTNPLLPTGPDPWVVWWKGFYYYSNTSGTDLTLRKTADITDLQHAEKKAVWTPEPGHQWSDELWAPELHRWGNKWYIYFAADAGDNASHRIYVVENDNDDPIEGTWTFKAKVSDSSDKWAIDPTTFELNGEHYLVWSGWEGDQDGEQDLFIAHMSNPWTIDSPRTMISKPTYPWEKHGDLPGRHVNVNEGPEVLLHGDKIFIVFSASGCWTDFYALASFRQMLAQPCSMPKVGRSSTTRSSRRILWPGPSDQDIMASSSHPTVNKIGLSTTPIRSRAKAAATFARPASSALPGTPMGRLTSARRFLWVNLWKNPHVKQQA